MIQRKLLVFIFAAALSLTAGAGSWAGLTERLGSQIAAARSDDCDGLRNFQRSFTEGFRDEGFKSVVNHALPSVVSVTSWKFVMARPSAPFQFLSDPFFWQFFGHDDLSQRFLAQYGTPVIRREHTQGSGVIVGANGLVITNQHVVAGAKKTMVSLGDGRELPAKTIGIDPMTDLALLKIDADGLPVIPFGDSTSVHVGEFVVAIGNPFGIGQSVSVGIVSAIDRRGFGTRNYEDFIQTDAAINPGSSGGALINSDGQLIGISTAIVSNGREGGNAGVAMAIPSNLVRYVIDELAASGKVVRGWMGVSLQPVTAELASAFKLPDTFRGALITDVLEEGPAAKQGLARGDIITDYNYATVKDRQDLELKSAMSKPGARVILGFIRNGQRQEAVLTLGEMPGAEKAVAEDSSPAPEESGPPYGFGVEALTKELLEKLDLDTETKGVVVNTIQPAGAAEEAGLSEGDIVEEINRRNVSTMDDFDKSVKSAGESPLLLLVNRGGKRRYLVVQPN
ncbi:MAG TPA: Do family serine endopeptidase [Terriglobia bacterium]|nr:Do family serine endopeptidase [Terriglobia bacterium]